MDHSNHFVVTSEILRNWMNAVPGWTTNISSNVYFGRSNFVFPVPDSTIIDEENKYSIAIEYKSTLENKRGALTALGQAIAYTLKYSMSYLVIPNKINEYDLERFMCELFQLKDINKILPVGLIVYDIDTNKPSLKFEIETTINSVKLKKFGGTYWATFRDSYPDSIWRILDISYLTDEKSNRKIKIWNTFYYEFLLPIPLEFWTNGELEDWLTYSKTYTWDDSSTQIIGKDKVKEGIDKVAEGEITLAMAKSNLGLRYFGSIKGDVPYVQLQKNIFNFINNLNLLDEFFYLTNTGFDLHKIGKLYGTTSQMFKDKLAKIVLIEGKHLDLIIEVSNLQKKIIKDIKSGLLTVPLSSNEHEFVLSEIVNDFHNKGKLKTNTLRSTSGKRKFLGSELQLWGKLGLVNKGSRSYYAEGAGFDFNWDKITDVLIER